jgi:hypothetical protein
MGTQRALLEVKDHDWTARFMRRLGLRDRSALFVFGMALLAYSVLAYTVHWHQCRDASSRQYALNEEVLRGAAAAPYQFQMYFLAPLLKQASLETQLLLRTGLGKSVRDESAFALTYWLFYSVGSFIFLTALFRYCASLSTDLSAAVACMYLVALFPLFWFDNYYHPSDPYGLFLTVLIVGRLLRRGTDWGYFVLLFVCGFFWEKHVFIPICYAIAALFERKRVAPLILPTIAGTALAAFGQLFARFLNAAPREWSGEFFPYNLKGLPWWFIWTCIVYGIQIYWTVTRSETIPPLFRAFALQFFIWPPIYIFMNGVVHETRGTFIMVALTWPVLSIAISHWMSKSAITRS